MLKRFTRHTPFDGAWQDSMDFFNIKVVRSVGRLRFRYEDALLVRNY
jgi:hypothetical protein